jgi:Tol biopolymer transport system component
MNADGSGVAPLTHGAPGFGQPAWSPDGKLIAFVAYPGSVPVVEAANADGTAAHRVSPRSWTSFNPV